MQLRNISSFEKIVPTDGYGLVNKYCRKCINYQWIVYVWKNDNSYMIHNKLMYFEKQEIIHA